MLERVVSVTPAYDCIMVQPCKFGLEACKPGSGRSHGRHPAELSFMVKGPTADVTLAIFTGWCLDITPVSKQAPGLFPMDGALMLHSANPLHPEQEPVRAKSAGCRWEACYSSSLSTGSNRHVKLLVAEGSDALWKALEEVYNEYFGDR